MTKNELKNIIKVYLSYGTSLTDAPPQFHLSHILTRIGHELGRKAVHPLKPHEIHHNLFTVFVGESRKSRKTTSRKIAHKLCQQPLSNPAGSYEGLFDELVVVPASIIDIDEGDQFLQHVSSRGSYGRAILRSSRNFMTALHWMTAPPNVEGPKLFESPISRLK